MECHLLIQLAALAMAVGFHEGFGGPFFPAVLVLNKIIVQLPAEHPLTGSTPFHEVLGHTLP